MKRIKPLLILGLLATLLFASGCAKKFYESGYPPDARSDISTNSETFGAPSGDDSNILRNLDLSNRSYVVIGDFDFDSALLKPEMKEALLSKVVKSGGKVAFVIATADEVGAHAYNKNLTDQRAESAKRFMASNGMDVSGTKFIGAGKITSFGKVHARNRCLIVVFENR